MVIKVFESQVTHTTDALHWMDAGTRHMNDKANRINELFNIEITNITTQTARLKSIQKPGTLVFHRPDQGLSFPQAPGDSAITTEEQRSAPSQVPFSLNAIIRHPTGRYNPRSVSLEIGNGEGHSVWIYPALHSHSRSRRALFGSLKFTDQSPARWALLTLTVEYAPPDKTITLYAQADAHGDFELPLLGLPPLAKGITHFGASLSVTASTLGEHDIPNPDTFSTMKMAESWDDDEFDFENALEFELHPDQRTRLSTAGSALLFITQDDD